MYSVGREFEVPAFQWRGCSRPPGVVPVTEGDVLVHARSKLKFQDRQRKHQERAAKRMILSASFHDARLGETVSLVSRVDVLCLLTGPVEIGDVPDVVNGEVLVDYRSHRLGAVRKIFCLKRGEEVCGVIVYCYPPPSCFGRKMVAPRMDMKKLNEKFSIISRVVVHPKYRTIGLGEKLVHETLHLTGTESVEMSAVMAKYNPFAEKAGMRKVAMQPPAKEAIRITQTLRMLGFNIELLGSEQYVLSKLQGLNEWQHAKVKEAFIKNKHQRFLKEFSGDLPFGKTEVYKREVENAALEKLARLVKICSFLLQTKVYLFWSKTSR
jgi:hypothetical protein